MLLLTEKRVSHLGFALSLSCVVRVSELQSGEAAVWDIQGVCELRCVMLW